MALMWLRVLHFDQRSLLGGTKILLSSECSGGQKKYSPVSVGEVINVLLLDTPVT